MQHPSRLALIVVAAAALLAGCTRTTTVVTGTEVLTGGPDRNAPLRSAANLPSSFIVVTPATVSGDCPSALRDAGLGTLFTLHRAVMQPVRDEQGTHYVAIGDYAAEPRGRYGDDEPGDGIRIDCARLRPLGIVRLAG
jgi:hypothetical protein